MQAIRTTWLEATDNKPSRIMAKCKRGKLTIFVGSIPYGHSRHHEDMHAYVAHMLIDKFQKEDNEQYGIHEVHAWHHNLTSGEYGQATYHCISRSFDTSIEAHWKQRRDLNA